MSGELVLRWREAETRSGDWQTLQAVDGLNLGFVETGRYLLAKPFDGAQFYVDDEPLPDDRTDRECWLWEPGFFAGEVTAELGSAEGSPLATYLLDVAPDPRKLGREVFATMVKELWDEDPTLVIGEEPALTAIGEMGDEEDPWLAFARLRRYGHETLRAVAAIRNCPRRALRVRRELVPLRTVRRVDRQSAVSLRGAGGLAVLRGSGANRGGGGERESRLDVPQMEDTLDCAANRSMLALQLALLRRTRTVSERLNKLVVNESTSETRSPLLARWPRRRAFLDDLAVHLKASIQSWPWRDVTRAEVSAAGLTAVAADPIYSRAWSRGWRALRPGMEEGESNERLWISPSWEIYERWCYVQIRKLLAEALPQWNWRRKARVWAGESGERRVEIELQPTFWAGLRGPDRRWSVSKQRKPDLLLTIQGPACRRFLLLDAKYRSSRANVLDAMTSAHVYRDSLRIGDQRPEAALLLLPAGGDAKELEELDFQRDHQVGVAVLTPGVKPNLPALITEFLTRWTRE